MNRQLIFSLSVVVAAVINLQTFAADQPPNVVILYADDMGVADVSYGDPDAKIQTPNIDRLAADGMTFTDGHSSSGICTPSRFALLTGQHHWRRFHGIVGAFGGTVFEDGEYTIAKMFQEKGYRTGAFGKWHLGWDFAAIRKPGVAKKDWPSPDSYDWTKRFPGGPLERGFDHYFGDGTINFPPYCWIEGDRFLTIPTRPVIKSEPLAGAGSFRPGPMAESWNPFDILPTITDKTVEWLGKQSADQPFFAYLAFNSPHYPIVPNKEFHGKSKAGYYGDFVIETDAQVGKVLNILEESGLADNTIVIFSADNGPETHAFERLEEFDQWSSGKYRGLKRNIYEGGHRVPFIVRWPGQVEPGSVSSEVVSQVDLAATFAEIVDYPLDNEEAIDSYNLLPVLKGEQYRSPLRTATVQNTFANAYALRQGDWVLINTSNGARKEPKSYLEHFGLQSYPKDNPGLLFNLKDDPRQSKNLYDQHPDRVNSMRQLLQRYIEGERCAPLRSNAAKTRPFQGKVHSIPGLIEAEHWDEGPAGVAYSDIEPQNKGENYREKTQVDIEKRSDASNGHGIGWTKKGEWLIYTVRVQETGNYRIEMPVASNKQGGKFNIEFDGKDVTGNIEVPDTGAWTQLEILIHDDVKLQAGTYQMKVNMLEEGASGSIGDIDYFKFTRQ